MKKLLAALALAGLLSGCASVAGGSDKIISAEVQRLPGAQVEITWTGSAADLYQAASPVARPPAMQRIASNDTSHKFIATAPVQPRNYYFVAIHGGRAGLAVAERLLPLEGGRNFRDLGGYATADGHHVRWGKLYRSGTMTSLTDNDYSYLSDLGIGVVCDFRTDSERNAEPTRWRAAPKASYVSFADEPSGRTAIPRRMLDPHTTPEAMRAKIIASYRHLPDQYKDRYAALFAHLAKGDIPLAFNCTAGKDRSGLAAGLILSALGVPRQTILDDYALTDKYVDYKAELKRGRTSGKPNALSEIGKLPQAVQDVVFRADPDYLQAAFAQIEKDHGSVENYLRDVLQVSDADLAKIRIELLE